MTKYSFNAEQLTKILQKTIDLFLEYQYKHGFDEPKARAEAIMDVVGALGSSREPGVPADA